MDGTFNYDKTTYQSSIPEAEFVNNKRTLTPFKTFFFLKAYQNPCQAQQNNKEFTQLRRHQQLLTSMHQALKVTAEILSPIQY